MRTLVLTEYFLPAVGGSINWLVNAYSRYDPHEVLCIAPRCEGDLAVDSTLPFQVNRVPMTFTDWDPLTSASLARYIQLLWRISRIQRMHKSQQIHCAKVFPEGLLACALNARRTVPYIVYAHGEEIQISLTSRKLSWLLPRVYNRAAAIIANSRNTHTLLEKIGVHPSKIHIINPGVNPQLFQVDHARARAVRQKFNLGDAPVILTVGRLQQRKGQDTVIKALPRIQAQCPDVKYVIVGSGAELEGLHKLVADLGLTRTVIFAGNIPDHELAAYYAACDVFVMPNRQIGADIEGFGIVYLEAGAAGKPVIGGKSGGTEDAIVENHTGLLVDGTSVEHVALAVLSLLLNPERARSMGAQGRCRVEQTFTWEAIVARTRMVANLVTPQTSMPTSMSV
ncbi:MAG: glycosyltransferase family 4 protein [Candidatus Tectimicrobiota bacterium]